jgi:hypothetical protein
MTSDSVNRRRALLAALASAVLCTGGIALAQNDAAALLRPLDTTVAIGTAVVADGALHVRGTGGDRITAHPSPLPTADLTCEADIALTGNGAAGLVVRATPDGGQCYAVLIDSGNQCLRIMALPWSGDLAATEIEVERGRSYRLSVSVFDHQGETYIDAALDGEPTLSANEPQRELPGSFVGFLNHATDATFDNLAVRGVAADPDEPPLISETFESPIDWAIGGPAREFSVSLEGATYTLSDAWPAQGAGPGSAAAFEHSVDDARHVWIPHLAPEGGYVIADHSFRSPALIVASDDIALAVIPDLDDVRRAHENGYAVWMDYDHPARTVTFAAGAHRLADEHVLYWPEQTPYAGQTVSLRLHVVASDLPADLRNPYGMVARWIWERWGHQGLAAGGAQRAPLSLYADYVNRWSFTPEPDGWEDTVWQSFRIEGRECGAPAFIVDVAQHPSVPVDQRRWREQRSVWNQAWFSTQRCANGLLRFARQRGDDDLAHRAELMTAVALAAPQDEGLFPAVYTCGGGGYSLYAENEDWDQGRWTNSNRRPPGVSGEAIHILDAAFTARLLLEWHGLTGDAEPLGIALAFADRLADLQLSSGAFPGWIEPDGSVPETLREGPESAMSTALLWELLGDDGISLSQERRLAYQEAARAATAYLIAGPVAESRWEDFETYFSCSRWWGDHIGQPIERNGVYKSNTFSPFWCAEAFLAAYRATGDDELLSVGRRCLDELSLYQQVWDPPYIPAPCHGGFAVMNSDGEWNDARQSLFAPLYLEYYAETGEAQYFERGVSALRASFAMLYCPENESVRREYERVHPFFGPESFGFMMENIAHGGPGSEPIGPFTIYTWGNGAALASYAKVRDLYGDLYIDVERGVAFGIDGCSARVEGATVHVSDPYGRNGLLARYSTGETVEVRLTDGQGTAPTMP